MKLRPQETTSERELLTAMSASGRSVSLAIFAGWRKDGLLPPLAAQGTGRGRSYYWREPNIVSHAQAVFDLMEKVPRRDAVLLQLFLSGFATPLPQLRRAWRYRNRMRKPPTIRFSPNGDGVEEPRLGDPEGGMPGLLFDMISSVCKALAVNDPTERMMARIFEKATMKFLRPGRENSELMLATIRRFWPMLRMTGNSLEASDLVASASDAQLLQAQDQLRRAAPIFEACARDVLPGQHAVGEAPWSFWLAEHMGPPLFLFLLAQLCGGHAEGLTRLAASVAGSGRWMEIPPALPAYLHA